MSSIFDWSLQAANNANADDNINWTEGQPPSSVNNSARAMMQRTKEFISDIGGIARASGTANMLTVFAKSPFTRYVDGIRITVWAGGTNPGPASLNANSVGARPIFCIGATGVGPVREGQIQAGGIYDFIYSAALDDGAGGWFLLNPTQIQLIPTGLIFMVAAPVTPAGCLYCNGQAVSRAQFAGLFSVIGGYWGSGDGHSTFNLPDYRGVFPRGWDDGRGVDGGRSFASLQWSQNLAHSHTFSGQTSSGGGHNHQGYDSRSSMPGAGQFLVSSSGEDGPMHAVGTTGWAGEHVHTFSGGTSGNGGSEARPTNAACYFVIKT